VFPSTFAAKSRDRVSKSVAVCESLSPLRGSPGKKAATQGSQSLALGSGLGLAIAERAARMHAGSISARNAVEGGLIVEMELPIL